MGNIRAHSKFSASGAERWTECTASVAASEGQPDRDTVYSVEGTFAHDLLEQVMKDEGAQIYTHFKGQKVPIEMMRHVLRAADFILGLAKQLGAEYLVEQKVYLDFIHPEMFGTFDGAILDHFGTLHVFDFKYGAGHAVSPKENLQMIFYGIGLAHKYQWNFQNVRLWIIQPRIAGGRDPVFWDVSIERLREYEKFFRDAVQRVETKPEFKEGSWCHWCKAKKVCPLKREAKNDKAIELFKQNPLKGGENGKEEKFTKEFKKEFAKGKVEIKEKIGKAKSESFGDFY